MADIPVSVPVFATLQDQRDDVLAEHQNDPNDEISALAAMVGMSGELQSKNSAIMNLFRFMLNVLPEITWIDETTIEVEAKVVCFFDGTDFVIKRNTSAIQLDLSDSGDLGLDTGSEASSTWYYVWLTGDGTGTTFSAVFSASASAPTGYDYVKLIGAVYNDGSSNIRKFFQQGKKIWYDTPVNVVSGADYDSGPTTVSFAAAIPSISRYASFRVYQEGTAANTRFGMAINGSARSYSGAEDYDLFGDPNGSGNQHVQATIDCFLDDSQQVAIKSFNASSIDIDVRWFELDID